MCKKIVFFSGDISRSGGTEKVSTMIANGLSERNYDISIISLNELNKESFFYIDSRVKRYTLQSKSYFCIIKELNSFIINEKIDIIIDIDGILDIYSLPCKLFSKVKVVSWEHFNFYQDLGNKYRKHIRKISGKFADQIITLTNQDREYYIQNLRLRSKIDFIYNPIESSEYKHHYTDTKTIISVGRLAYQKGFDMLIEVAKVVLKKNPDWKWMILGEGDTREELEKKILEYGLENRLLLLGNVKNVDDYYQQSSFFVMTSRFEGLPMTLLEAKKYMLPIISFDCKTGPRELIKDSINGFLIEEFNIEKMVKRINQLIGDENLNNSFSSFSIEGLNEFAYTTVLDKWERILNQL